MRTRVLLFAVLFAAAVSCGKEGIHPLPEGSTTIHYQVTANSAVNTRATVNGSMQYVFSEGDRLYLSGTGDAAGKIYGYLDLISGAGTTTASFEGDLAGAEGYTATSSTALSAVLVGSSDALHSASGGVASAPDYDQAVASTFEEAIQKYSHFTAALQFGDTDVTLSQQSSFLCFFLTLPAEDFPSDVTVSLKQSGEDKYRWTITPSSLSTQAVRASFVVAFPGGSTDIATSTNLFVQSGSNEPVELDPLGTITELAANTYYTIRRTAFSWQGFAINILSDGTNITLNYFTGILPTSDTPTRDVTDVYYSLDEGASWVSVNENTTVSGLSFGDRLCLKSKGNVYNGYVNGSQLRLFESNKLCRISGDMMSLLCNDDWSFKTVAAVDAFNSLFKNASFIDIDKDDPLILSATTLNNKCYKNMFNGCSNLTAAPVLPATNLVGDGNNGCYNLMFNNCSNLEYVKCLATSNMGDGKSTVSWLNNVKSTGTFVSATGDATGWPGNANGIPSSWTIEAP